MEYDSESGKWIIRDIAKEVYVHHEAKEKDCYIEINDIFEMQYVVFFMILNPDIKAYISVTKNHSSEISDNYYRLSELLRFVGRAFDDRLFIESTSGEYAGRFKDRNMAHMGDIAPIIPIFSNSNHLFRDFGDISGINDSNFANNSNILMYLDLILNYIQYIKIKNLPNCQ